METMCPGQDTRYWAPGDVFEVECGDCGYEVEFFKDDAQRRCPKCGTRVSNPKLNLGCAQWCEHAEKCLGYDPKERMEQAEGGHEAVTDRLLSSLKSAPGSDQEAYQRAVKTLNQAQTLFRQEGGKPKVILSAAVLLHLDGNKEEPVKAVEIMKEAGLDKYSLEEAAGIISDFRTGNENNSLEFKIVADADRLVGLDREDEEGKNKEGHEELENVFWTKAGKEAAEVVLSGSAT
jgi:hypothetical protein